MPRLFHVSDVHFGAEDPAAIAWFDGLVADERPDAVVMTGDLTMRATPREFEEGGAWLRSLGVPVTLEVGNHDIPYYWDPLRRLVAPYTRYAAVEKMIERPLEIAGVTVVPLKTTARAQWRWNWSKGRVSPGSLRSALAMIAEAKRGAGGGVILVAAHHPLIEGPTTGTARTRHGDSALTALAEAGADAVLSGHVHDPFDVPVERAGRTLRMIGAGTLSRRIRSSPPSFNELRIDDARIEVVPRRMDRAAAPLAEGAPSRLASRRSREEAQKMIELTRPDGCEAEDFHLTRRTAVGMFFAGYALAAVSAEAAPITTPADGLTVEEVLIPNGAAKPLPAYVARPTGPGRHAAILVASEIFGVHEYIKDICRRLARLGYVAIAPDFFYRSGVNLPALTDFAQIMPIVKQASDTQVDGDVRAATDWLKARAFVKPAAIGVTGFCWGGAVAWRSAMGDPDVKAAVAWYGQLKPLVARAGEVRAPVLGLYGGQDKGITADDVAAMQAALTAAGKKDSSIHVYPDAGHAFHADYRASYVEADAKDGWARMLAHLRSQGVA